MVHRLYHVSAFKLKGGWIWRTETAKINGLINELI